MLNYIVTKSDSHFLITGSRKKWQLYKVRKAKARIREKAHNFKSHFVDIVLCS